MINGLVIPPFLRGLLSRTTPPVSVSLHGKGLADNPFKSNVPEKVFDLTTLVGPNLQVTNKKN